jgi:hypothetical protein
VTVLPPHPVYGKSWIHTFTGRRYNLVDPNPEVLTIQDVAHALSLICRYTGHVRTHYSVAQHSVLAAFSVPSELRVMALLHDGHECVTGDVASPIKRRLGEVWRAFEHAHEIPFRARFGLPAEFPLAVKEVDVRLLATEERDLLVPGEGTDEWRRDVQDYARDLGVSCVPYDVRIEPWSAPQAEEMFLLCARIFGVRE